MITIFHNPRCTTSRYVLDLISQSGKQFQVIDYLKTPPSEDTLRVIAARIDGGMAGILRKKAKEYQEFNLEGASDEVILAAIAEHPVLIERPLIVTPSAIFISRPKDKIKDYL